MAVNKLGRKNRALIISVSNYDNRHPLDFCKNDGDEMFNILNNLGYEILDNNKLIGTVRWEAMSDAIIDFFSDPKIKPQDTLLFYYSGHGVPDIDGDVYLATSEINPDVPNRRGFSFNELTKMIQRSISTRIIAILDCCYSGSAKLSKGNGDEDATKLAVATIDNRSKLLKQGEGKCILAASQAYQEAYELAEQDHSVFTYYLLQGLKGDKGALDINCYVTVDSLSKFVYDTMMSLPPGKRPKQKPIRKVEASGDIILAYYPKLVDGGIRNNQLNPPHKSSINKEIIIEGKKDFEKSTPRFVETKEQSTMTDDEDLHTLSIDYSAGKSNLNEPTNDISQKIIMLEAYIKDRKLQKNLTISMCARDLGISINEVRALLSYLSENKFRCTSCIQRFRTINGLNIHIETEHKI
jgi:Caspase domain